MFYEAVPGRIPDDMQSWFDLGCINNHLFYHPTDGQENPSPSDLRNDLCESEGLPFQDHGKEPNKNNDKYQRAMRNR